MFENATEIILKVTRDCNFRCEYCYIKDKDTYKGERMSYATFRQLIDRVVSDREKDCRVKKIPGLQIVFHGGEPTLLDVSEMERFIKYAQIRIPGVSFSIQTNLSLVDVHWSELFAKYQIQPGLSIDGVKETHNRFRKEGFVFKDKLKMLRKYGVNYGVLLIISKANIDNYFKNIMELKKLTGQERIKANYAENTLSPEPGDPEVSVDELYEKVFLPTVKLLLEKHVLLEQNVTDMVKDFIEHLIFDRFQEARSLPETNCLTKFCSGGNNVIEVDPDGNVCFCGRWANVNELNKLGNYFDASDIFGLNSFRKIVNLQKMKSAAIYQRKCEECFASDICGFGCIAFSYDKYAGEIKIREDLVCDYTKRVKKFLQDNRYQIMYAYVKSKNWNISRDKQKVLLNIPPSSSKLIKKDSINDKNLQWVTLSGKRDYVTVPAKEIKRKVSWR